MDEIKEITRLLQEAVAKYEKLKANHNVALFQNDQLKKRLFRKEKDEFSLKLLGKDFGESVDRAKAIIRAGAGADLTCNTGQLTTTVPSGLISVSAGTSPPVGFFTTTGGAGEGAREGTVGVLITSS